MGRINYFQQDEIEGRSRLVQLFPSQTFFFSEGTYDHYDAIADNSMIEIKTRNFNSSRYPTTVLEVKKLKNLKAAMELKGCSRIFYVVHFMDGTGIWDVTGLDDYNITKMSAPKQTRGNLEKITKDFIELNMDQCIFYPKKCVIL